MVMYENKLAILKKMEPQMNLKQHIFVNEATSQCIVIIMILL